MSKLIPCPFCGGKAYETAHIEHSWFAPECARCGAKGPSVKIETWLEQTTALELLNKADELWNMRVAATDATS